MKAICFIAMALKYPNSCYKTANGFMLAEMQLHSRIQVFPLLLIAISLLLQIGGSMNILLKNFKR